MEQPTLENITQALYAPEAGGDEASAFLYGLKGKMRGGNYALAATATQIGRSADCDIQVDSGVVSSQHCRILRDDSGLFCIVDDGSKNGTQANGKSLPVGQRLQLAHGDNIVIGDSVFVFLSPRQTAQAHVVEKIQIDLQAASLEGQQIVESSEILRNLRKRKRD